MPRHDVTPTLLLGAGSLALSSCATAPRPAASTPTSVPISFEVHEGTKLAFDLSADGRTVVFDLLGQLWTLPSSGGSARAVTDAVRDSSEDLRPTISADGTRIAFRADRPGGGGIFVATTGQAAVQRIVSDTLGVGVDQPAWLPDGSHTVFVNAPWLQRRGGRVWEVPAAGGDARPWTAQGVDALGPRYSSDGQRLAFFTLDSAGRFQVAVAERDKPPRSLTSQQDVLPQSVRWEPGGESLIYRAEGRPLARACQWRSSGRHTLLGAGGVRSPPC